MGSCAFVGLGMMGLPMAQHIQRSGRRVVGVDLSPQRCRQLESCGAESASALAEVASQVESVIVMVVSSEQVTAVLRPAAARLKPGTQIIIASTISPASYLEFHRELSGRGLVVVDAPVSGGNTGAEAGTLVSMLGGEDRARARALPLIECYSSKVYQGTKPGDGMLLKVLHQHLAGIHAAAAMEVIALCEQSGVDSSLFRELVVSAAGNSWMFEFWSEFAIKRDLTPRSTIDIFTKDLTCVVDQAQQCGGYAPLALQAQRLFLEGQERGYGAQAPVALVDLLKEHQTEDAVPAAKQEEV